MTLLGEFLQDQIRKRGLTLREFAKMCDVTHSVISKALSEKDPTTPRVETLAKIASATGVDLFTLVALIAPDATDIDVDARIYANEIVSLPRDKRREAEMFLKGLIYEAAQERG